MERWGVSAIERKKKSLGVQNNQTKNRVMKVRTKRQKKKINKKENKKKWKANESTYVCLKGKEEQTRSKKERIR